MGGNVRASSISSYLSQAMYAHLTPDGELRDHTYPIDNTRAAAMYEKAACLGVAVASAAVCRAEMHVHALGGAPEQSHASSDDAEVDVAADEMGASRSPRSAGI